MFKSIAAGVLLTAGVVGTRSSDVAAIRYTHRIVESANCRGHRDDDRGHDSGDHGGRGHDDRGHEDRGHDDDRRPDHHDHHGGNHGPGLGLQQMISVRVPPTILLRVDKLGRVTAAATNTGCQPSKQDDVFLLRPNGAIEPTTLLHVDRCDWTGDFSVPGRFQPQWCNAALHRHRVDDSQRRASVGQLGSVTFDSVVVVGS